MSEKDKLAAVCYCLLAHKKSSEGMTDLIGQCQEILENAGYYEVQQSFAVGRDFSFAVPFRTYGQGFRVALDESERRTAYKENLVLSFGLLSSYREKLNREMNCYLILLSNDDELEMDEMRPLLHRFDEFKTDPRMNLRICSVGVWEGKEEGFVDAYGMDALKKLL